MTTLQENILVIVIIVLNSLVALSYFIYGFAKTRKKKKAMAAPEPEAPIKAEDIREDTGPEEVEKEADTKKSAKQNQEGKPGIGQEDEKNQKAKQKEAKAKKAGKADKAQEKEKPKLQTDNSETPNAKPEEKFAKDESGRRDTLCKYTILSIFIFLCPIASEIFLGLGTLLYRIFFDSSIDLAAITFSKERVDVLEHPDMDEEINLVPMEEAIMIDDKESLRQLLLTVLRGDVSKSISAVSKALNSSDSEASHYAASAIMDIMNDFQNTLQKFHAQLEANPDDREVNQLFIEYLIKMLNANFLSDLEIKTYVYMLQSNCETVFQKDPTILRPEYYTSVVNLLMRIGDIQTASQWVGRLQQNYPDNMEMYRCALHFYFDTRDKDSFFNYLNQLKKSDISIDKDLLELIRVFL